jgi:hypothetical protein
MVKLAILGSDPAGSGAEFGNCWKVTMTGNADEKFGKGPLQ